MGENEPFSQLIVIGSSAGGIDALSRLVGTFSSDIPAPIIVAQHLDPARQSHLADILGRRGTLRVRTLVDREPLEPGVIYVVPSNRDVEVTDHEIALNSDGSRRSKPSIDLLFESAARIFGDRLIAIILTGSGNDGAAGAFEVQRFGGTVIIQDPETASYPAMPRSLAPGVVDIVAKLEDMGRILDSVLANTAVLDGNEQSALQTLTQRLREQHGVDFSSYKRPTILRRLQRRLVATGTTSVGQYLDYVQRHPQEQQTLIATLLIKVTQFFRDSDLFEELRAHLLPEIVETARQEGRELRLWSAGCATGEEAYSLAITVAELLDSDLSGLRVRIFATDLDADAIAFARQGIYPASSLAGLAPELIAKYFDQIDSGYQIKKFIRALMVFGQHDLGDRAPFPRIDLLLCRNVLIYFTPELQRQVLQLFAFSLRDGGYLVLGKSETTSQFPDAFQRADQHLKIFRRRSDQPVTLYNSRTRFRSLIANRAAPPTASNLPPASGVTKESAGRNKRQERTDVLLRDLPLGIIVVDRHYDIQYLNEAARSLLAVHASALGDDLVHLARNISAAELRSVIDAAFEPGDTPSSVLESREEATDRTRYLNIAARGQTADDRPVETVTITVSDVTDVVERQRHMGEQLAGVMAENHRLTDRAERLTQANNDLLATNHQLTREISNLRSRNEEYLVGNEELQAASEEIESLNEELQATNEELETLNEELQATVEELNTTNDDLQAQSVEMQDLATRRDIDRARMDAILATMQDALLVTDREGRVVLTNVAYDRLFSDANAGALLADEQGNPLEQNESPERRVARGETFRANFQLRSEDGERRVLEGIGQPIRGGDPGGGILVIRDITDRPTSGQ